MKKIIYLLFSIIIIFIDVQVYAKSESWPNSNDYNYIDYEVKTVYDATNPITSLLLIGEESENNNKANFIINYKFNIQLYKSKVFTVYILKKLKELAKSITDIDNNYIVQDYIKVHENSSDYGAENIWNKFIVWVILEKKFKAESYKRDKTIFKNLDDRRVMLLNNIAKNNSDCAPLAKYIITVIECPITSEYSKKEAIIKYQTALRVFIDEFPNTEYAACAHGELIGCLGLLGETSEAEKTALQVFNKYANFYTVGSDFYSDIYNDLLLIYYRMNNPDQEKIKLYLDRLNKKSHDYETVCNFFNDKLNNVK